MRFEHVEKIISYKDFVSEVERIRTDFIIDKERLENNFNYSNSYKRERKAFVNYLDSYKNLMLNVLRKTLKIFNPFLSNINHMVIVSGSFARNSHRDYSDLDVSIVLGKRKTKSYIIFEELFYYALSKILNMSRDRVHSVFINMVDKSSAKSNDTEYTLFWNDTKDSLSYQARDNTGVDLALSLETERLYSTILKDVKTSLEKCVYTEFSYVYEVIENSLGKDLTRDILDIELGIKENQDFKISEPNTSDISGHISSRDLKKRVKGNFFNEFNTFCSYIRHYAVVNYGYDKLLDIKQILKDKVFRNILGKNQAKLFNSYYEYVWYLTRLENCLNKFNYELSSHNYTLIDCDKVKMLYKVMYATDEDIFGILLKFQSKIKDVYLSCLKELNKEESTSEKNN